MNVHANYKSLNQSFIIPQFNHFNQRQMRIDIKDIFLLFENIQNQLNISHVSIVIFTALDVDSLCTLKIFSKLFKSESIQYKVYPVTTYAQLQNRIQQSKIYDKVKLFFFINCGGIIDLTQYWFIQQQKNAQIFLFDINKPIHHKNLQSKHIKIVDDGYSQLQNCPTTQEIQKYDELNEYDFEDNNQQQLQLDEDDSPKRRNNRMFKQKLKKHRDLIHVKINNYYGNHFFSYPSSYSAYRMIRDLKKANNQYLWYAIIGITAMYLQQKITREILEQVSQIYSTDVARFNTQNNHKKQKGQIFVKKGYQFTLLNHWSLYDSMLHSNYLMTKLKLYEDYGLKKLNQFIHNIGISLQQAKQLYKYMSSESQSKLENSIYNVAEKQSLYEVAFMSFMRQTDYSAAFMASDYYYILISILESPPKIPVAYDKLSEYRIKCFWQAYDIFDGPLKNLMTKIEDYKKTVHILMKQTRNILQRDHLISTNNVSIANIKSDTDDRKIFEHPSVLIRIAYILMGILSQKAKQRNKNKPIQQKKQKVIKPFIANWIDLQKQICLVVGVMIDNKNSLGKKFNEIASKLNIQVNHDNFMANIIIIKKDNLSQFIKEIGQC